MTEARRPRVLVIDDDRSVLDVMRYLLAEFGYDAETASDGMSGLERFEEGGWDLVLTDLAMPNMNGWELIQAIRRRAPSTAIVLVTAFSDAEIMRRASEWHVPVVTKPFPIAVLQAAVAEALHPNPSKPP